MSKKSKVAKPAKPNTGRPKAISKEGSIFDGVSCYVLSDDRRVIVKRAMAGALGGNVATTEPTVLERYIERLPNGSALLTARPNIEFSLPKGGVAEGIEAGTIAKMLRLYAEAWGAGSLRANQIPVAQRAVKMLSQFAEIGIVALIDEATGHQSRRPKDALQQRLLDMIRAEQDDIDPVYKPLLVELARLPGSSHCDYDGTGNPPAWGPLAANICKSCVWDDAGMARFRELNPMPSREHRDTQHLTAEGKKLLVRVLGIAEAFASTSRNWDEWRSKMEKHFKGKPLQMWLM